MSAIARVAACLTILCAFLLAPAGRNDVHATDESPVAIVNTIDDALFDLQASILSGDDPATQAALTEAEQQIAAFSTLPDVDSASANELSSTISQLSSATVSGDGAKVAFLRGQLLGIILRISFAATLASIAAGDFDAAGDWLLVRLFSPASRLARPSANSAIAMAELKNGTITAEDAAAIVRADLLDTYQGEVRRRLEDAVDSHASGRSLATAESLGMAQALWPLLSPAFGDQAGAGAMADGDAAFQSLGAEMAEADQATIAQLLATLDMFRAAPLTIDEQQARSRQIMLYLGLVPVEYKRGVRGGAVVSDIEIQEAITFLEGAKAAYSDLRATLNSIDPAAAAAISTQFAELDALLKAAANKTSIAEPAEISTRANQIESATTSLVPGEWLKAGGNADFDVVISLLEQMESAAAAGQYQQAESARLEAYAIYDMGAEKRLLAFAPGLAQSIEVSFWQGTGDSPGLATLIANRAPISAITKARVELVRDLSEARQRLGAGSTATGAIIFNSASIVFREGLEAVLILASLLASMTGDNRVLKRPLAYGALVALAMTAVLFFLTRSILLSLSEYSERVEAVVSVLAIAVLLLVMNWFFHKVYWTKWIAKHHQRRRVVIGGITGQVLGLVLLGFTSVFREGAETVLFLQALVLDAGTTVVIQGTLLGLVGVAIVGFLMFKLQAKLPHKKMLMVTGVMISLVLVTMVGKTVHVLQAVGWAPIHPIAEWAPPYWMSVWLGIFPTWESVLMQVVAIVFVFGSYFAAERSHEKSRQKLYAQAQIGAVVQ